MSEIDKYIQMLHSPKARVRYDACEQLRVSPISSEGAVAALEKATHDPDHEVAEAAANALEADAHTDILARLGRPSPKSEEKARRAEKEQRLARMLLVTTPTIEGRPVVEYLGIVSAEVVLGTGFLSELGAGFADFFGARAGEFQNKLRSAEAAAMSELRARAFDLQSDAVVGVDLDYSIIANNMLMVVANGTAVRLEPGPNVHVGGTSTT